MKTNFCETVTGYGWMADTVCQQWDIKTFDPNQKGLLSLTKAHTKSEPKYVNAGFVRLFTTHR